MTRTFRTRTLLLALTLCPLLPGAASAQVAAPGPELQGERCSVEGLMDSIRRGLQSNSEAYKRYMKTLLRESAVTLPDSELRAAFERERDPVMSEHLAAALVARTERGADPEAIKAVAKRALEERDPALRAAVDRWLAERPRRPEGVPASAWLRWEQDKHQRLLSPQDAVTTSPTSTPDLQEETA